MNHWKSLLALLAMVVSLVGTAQAKENPAVPKSDAKNESEVRRLFGEFASAWNRHDVHRIAKMWMEDGDHVEPDGHVAKGQAEIARLFGAQHMGPFKESTLKLNIDSIWFIKADVVLVDGTYQLSGALAPSGQDLGVRVGRLTSVLLNDGGTWRLAANRLMIPTSLPYRDK